jgi:hypothetical protein
MLVDSDHRVWSCGSYEDPPPDDAPPVFVPVWPASSPSAASVVLIACGFEHSVLVLASGCCLAWGSNAHGQLGVSCAVTMFSKQPRYALAAPFLDL